MRDQPELYGPIPSGPTAWRTLEAVGERERRRIAAARARVRRRIWGLINARHGMDPPSRVADVDLKIPNPYRRDLLVTVDGAGATLEPIRHTSGLNAVHRRRAHYSVGSTSTPAHAPRSGSPTSRICST